MVTLAEPKRSCVQMGEFMCERDLCSTAKHFQKGRMSLKHSTNLGFVAEWPDGSRSLVKDLKADLQCATRGLRMYLSTDWDTEANQVHA